LEILVGGKEEEEQGRDRSVERAPCVGSVIISQFVGSFFFFWPVLICTADLL
jgi:hypothetical protein